VLASHQVVFNEVPGRTHKYVHEIKMHDQTLFLKRAYPIVFSLRPQVEKTISDMERIGVIKRESSPFASAMTVVKKKDGTVRVCLDTRRVNQEMVADYEAPRPLQKIFHIRSGPSGTRSKLFSGSRSQKHENIFEHSSVCVGSTADFATNTATRRPH
jgi:hypothetical protein